MKYLWVALAAAMLSGCAVVPVPYPYAAVPEPSVSVGVSVPVYRGGGYYRGHYGGPHGYGRPHYRRW